jgi:hypothetical protein
LARAFGNRQPQFYRRPFADFTPDQDSSPGLLHETFDHRKSKAGSLANAFRREEWLGSASERIVVHARAIVLHRKHDASVGHLFMLRHFTRYCD